MISGINLSEVVEFTLPEDKENPTVWKLGLIPSGLLAQIGGKGKENPIEVTLTLLQVGLRGWVNFNGIEFKTEKKEICGQSVNVVPIDLINQIPLNAMMALSEKLIEINHLTPPERKN
jgi:hypothetical protein